MVIFIDHNPKGNEEHDLSTLIIDLAVPCDLDVLHQVDCKLAPFVSYFD